MLTPFVVRLLISFLSLSLFKDLLSILRLEAKTNQILLVIAIILAIVYAVLGGMIK